MEEILKQLNDVQKEAVLYNSGPSLVVAGAGSGKTRVLTYKIAALLEQGYAPNNILAITFTNKAANEMKQRIAHVIGEKNARILWMGTFHSIFARILRIEGSVLGFSSAFTIYDTNDSKSRLKSVVRDLNLDEKKYDPKKILWRISSLKNALITPSAYEKNAAEKSVDSNIPRLGLVYKTYMNECHRANAMDFDDILLYTNVLFRDYPEILAKYQDIFKYVLVDEYQDTNFSQHLIVSKICEKHHKVCVVGDDAQSIYSFRGANINNILHFKDNYPEYRLFKLEQNYRSTQNIVWAANSLIAKNEKQIAKNVFSKNEVGSKIKVFETESDTHESEKICDILRWELRSDDFQDTAILYRTKAQSRKIEETLLKNRIPYFIYGGMSFYELKVVKNIFAYFRLIVNPYDEEAFKRAVKYPKKGIGDTTIEKITQAAKEKNTSVWDILSDSLGNGLDLSAATIKRVQSFKSKIDELAELASSTDAYTLSDRVFHDFGIIEELNLDQSADGKEEQRLAEEVRNSIHDFIEANDDEDGNIGIGNYLSSVALMTELDNNGTQQEKNAVTMMTVHSAKGLEFKNVIIAGMEEGLFPTQMSYNENNIEEERRLFYVALTRAEQRCFITYANQRFRNGITQWSAHSSFLDDIDPKFLELPKNFNKKSSQKPDDDFDFYRFRRNSFSGNQYGFNDNSTPHYRSYEREKPQYSQPTRPSNPSLKKIATQPTTATQADLPNHSGYEVGEVVEHERFGKGTITNIEAMGGDYKISINFDMGGEKKILKKYANLKKI